MVSGCSSISININTPSPSPTQKPAALPEPNQELTKKSIKIPVIFNKAVNDQLVQVMDENLIKEIYTEKFVNSIKVFIFLKSDDPEGLHGGIDAKGNFYDLGEISSILLPQDIDLVSINFTELFNKKFLRIDGIVGANAAQSNYFLLMNGMPSPFIKIDGNIIEFDIDGDGQKEIVSSSGTAAYTYIYKYENGNINVADLNAALGAEAIIFNDSKGAVFEAYYKGQPNQSSLFKFNGKEMISAN